ncbi:MAG: DNA polymerase III subunit delta' [Ruminococcaceae bacterium]|nr:DNA polymerase III subunit delta' [Oscillospiraceae bacterium]
MSFPLISNEKLRFALEAAIKHDHIPHAIILEGEAGLGKHTLAAYLSRAILCSENKKPCGECKSCRLNLSGSHPDVITVAPEDKKKNISVNQIRELRQTAFVKPHMAERKVLIIDKAETMNEQSQNALLKVLEEPPKSVYFILIAETAAALLETVLSRCVKFTLSVPEKAAAKEWISSNVKPKRDDELIESALVSSKGNIGRAITLLRKKSDNSPESAAREFSCMLFDGDEFGMLCLLNRFEKDRPAADAFFASLKYNIATLLRENYRDTSKAKLLTELYSLIDSFTASLKTNINLSLLFTALVAAIEKLRKNYLK